jgi:hypothetical protein
MGIATATVRGGFYEANGATPLASIQGSGWPRRQVARLMGTKGLMDERALARALDGVVAGSNATKTLARIENNTELGGKRVVETETLINRNTVAGDVTALNNDLFTYSGATTMASPANKDGNPLGTR